jgi:hypothetical protein
MYLYLMEEKRRYCNSKATTSSQNRHVRNILFGPPSSANIAHPYDNLGANCVLRNRPSYCVTIFSMCSTILIYKHRTSNALHLSHNAGLSTPVPRLQEAWCNMSRHFPFSNCVTSFSRCGCSNNFWRYNFPLKQKVLLKNSPKYEFSYKIWTEKYNGLFHTPEC